MSQSQRSVWDDPYIQRIAAVFFQGYERGRDEWEETVKMFGAEIFRNFVAADVPHSAAFFEGKTKEEMQALTPMMATAAGVCFAIRYALEARNG